MTQRKESKVVVNEKAKHVISRNGKIHIGIWITAPPIVMSSYTTQSVDTSIVKKRELFQYDDSFSLPFDSGMNPVNQINA